MAISWLVLKWSPISFDPLAFLEPNKFGPREMWLCIKMPINNFHSGTKLLGAHIYWGPYFSGKIWIL